MRTVIFAAIAALSALTPAYAADPSMGTTTTATQCNQDDYNKNCGGALSSSEGCQTYLKSHPECSSTTSGNKTGN